MCFSIYAYTDCRRFHEGERHRQMIYNILNKSTEPLLFYNFDEYKVYLHIILCFLNLNYMYHSILLFLNYVLSMWLWIPICTNILRININSTGINVINYIHLKILKQNFPPKKRQIYNLCIMAMYIYSIHPIKINSDPMLCYYK